jgi:hypothetical protein
MDLMTTLDSLGDYWELMSVCCVGSSCQFDSQWMMLMTHVVAYLMNECCETL